MAKRYRVKLTRAEREQLEEVIARRSEKALPVKRAYVLLQADEGPEGPGWTDQMIAATYQVSVRTIERVRERLVEEGLETALYGKARTYTPAVRLDGNVEAHLVALRCSAPPAGYAQWTLRLLAEQMVQLEYVEAISHESVRQLLKKTS
jgi:transposase